MPDVDAEKASLDSGSVSFMETLISSEHGPGGLQNGFSPNLFDEDRPDALSGGGADDKTENTENSLTPSEQICPVGLHKAVLLYPPSALALTQHFTIVSVRQLFTFSWRFACVSFCVR